MIRDDKQRVIGKLININSDKFTVELLNQSINFTINGYDDIYQYAQINGYVILPYQDFYIIAEIFGVREKDADRKWHGKQEQVLSKANSVKYLDINPVGTIKNKKFKYGLSIFPTLYSDVLYIRKEELDIIFDLQNEEELIEDTEDTKLKLLEIGSSTIFPDYKVKLDINGFFGAHSAVLGNTGSGKSCTISAMIQNLFKKKNFSAVGASFIFFDVNGEYHKAFSKIENKDINIKYLSINEEQEVERFEQMYDDKVNPNIEYEKFELPHWFLNIEEWALLLQASEKTQLPILRSALGFSQTMDKTSKQHIYASNIQYVFDNWISTLPKRQKIISLINNGDLDIDTQYYDAKFGNFPSAKKEDDFKEEVVNYIKPQKFKSPNYKNEKFSFNKLEEHIDEAILFEEFHGNNQIREYCASLFTRYKSIKEREEFNFLTDSDYSDSIEEYVDNLLGVSQNNVKKTQVTIINLNSIDDEIVEVISCVLSRLIFNKLKTKDPRNKFPVNMVLEEAHRYISNDKNYSFIEAAKTYDRIAKEGRKYGLFLLLSSQRPSELSKTVLSQCSNFIIHRIQNPEDLSQIRQMTPHISANILSRLPSIPRQHALVFGHSVQIPTLFKVSEANPTPYSSDNDISSNWFIAKEGE